MAGKPLIFLGVGLLIFEVFFALIYAFIYQYNPVFNSSGFDISGLFVAISIGIMILLGFGLMSTYIYNFALSGMVLVFFILAFTIQYYFIVWSFWVKTGLSSSTNTGSFNITEFITLGLSNRDDRIILDSVIQSTSLHQAMACALSLIVALYAVLGRTGLLDTLILCLFGGFFYAFLEAIFWRISILDAGFGARIFMYGSSLGLVSSLILAKKNLTKQNRFYHSSKSYQTLSLLGMIFAWIFIPTLSTVNQLHKYVDITRTIPRVTYAHHGPFNIFFALCASTVAAFCVSMLINKKISVHDIIFSALSGAIAFGTTSDIMMNIFPAMLVGTTAGIVSTLGNSLLKKKINANGNVDSQGVLFSFLIPGLIGSIYSSIIAAIDTQSPGGNGLSMLILNDRTFNGQGALQLAGAGIAIGCGAIAGIIVGLLYKATNQEFSNENQQFNDDTFMKLDNATDQQPSPHIQEMQNHSNKPIKPPMGKNSQKKISEIMFKSGSQIK